jgi:long-chain fatty acid transport protein
MPLNQHGGREATCLVARQWLPKFDSKTQIMKKNNPVQKKLQFGVTKQLKLVLCVATPLTATVTTLNAEGFRDATTGAFDLGRSGGRIAQVDDATAVQNNPANLVDVTNAMAELDPSVIYISVNYKSPDGSQSASTIHPLKTLPSFFASLPLFDDRLAFGFGVTIPFGLANQWSTSSSAFSRPGGALSSTAFFGKLTTYNFNPSVAVKIGDHIQIGTGLDVMWSQLELRQYIAPTVLPWEAHASGDGVGVGGNLGITWKITDAQRLALTYRSTMTVDYSGSADIENTGSPNNPTSTFSTQVKYPNIISAGYGIDLTDKVRLESDFEWLQFSQFKNLGIKTGDFPALGGASLTQNVAENWHNTFTAGIGGDWKFADHWVLRAGYEYFESPVPNSTFSPTIPDANQNVMTVGLGWHGKQASFEFAYGLDIYNDRNINNPSTSPDYASNGKYTFNVHLFSLAFRYAF